MLSHARTRGLEMGVGWVYMLTTQELTTTALSVTVLRHDC